MGRLKQFRFWDLLKSLLNAALLVCLAGQSLVAACLLLYGYVPLPSAGINWLIARQAPETFHLTVETARLHGPRLFFSNLQVRTDPDREPLLTFRSVDVGFNWLDLRAFPQAETISTSGGTLYSPAEDAPNGRYTALLERLALSLTLHETGWRVDRFAALHENIRLLGSFTLPHRGSLDTAGDTDWLDQFYEQAAILSSQKKRIRNFEEPTILFSADRQSDGNLTVSVNAHSPRLNHPVVEAKQIHIRGEFRSVDGSFSAVEAPILRFSNLNAPGYKLEVSDTIIRIAAEQLSPLLNGEWPRLELAASRMDISGYPIEAPIFRLDAKNLPEIYFRGGAGGIENAIQLNGRINASDWSGAVDVDGSLDFADLIPEGMLRRFPKIQFPDGHHLSLDLKFDAGLTVSEATLNAFAQNLQVEAVHFDRMRARGHYSGDQYSIEELQLSRKGQSIDLSLDFDPSSLDYRLGLVGTAVPDQYNRLLPDWWAGIFRNFSFHETSEVSGDFVIRGKTDREVPDYFFGHIGVDDVSYRGVPINAGEVVVQGRQRFTQLQDLELDTGTGWARGNIAFAFRADGVKGLAAMHLDLEGELPLDSIERLVPKDLAPKIREFETDGLPRIQLRGSFLNQTYSGNTGESHFTLEAECPASVSYKKILFDGIRFQLHSRAKGIHLRDVEFGYADGQGTGSADILSKTGLEPHLVYKLALLDTDRDLAFVGLSHFGALGQSLEPAEKQPSSTGAELKEQARLDLYLHGQGSATDIWGHSGFGRFELRDDDLTTLQLLGPLSRLLEKTELNFTSFNLNTMRGEFAYEDAQVAFDPLRIDGLRTQIQAPGTLSLRDQAINMRVSIFLFGNTGSRESRLRQIRDLIKKPIPNLLEFELTGTLENQRFRSLYDPRNLLPEL